MPETRMIEIEQVETLNHPELQPYLTLRRPEEHKRQGIFVAEGGKVVQRLLEAEFPIVSFLLTPEWWAELESLIRNRPESRIRVFLVERRKMEKLTGYPFYQGLLAVARVPPLPTLDEVLTATPRPRLYVAIESVRNAQNLGLVVRNCAAFGVQAFLVGETASSPFLRRAVRNSMGSIFLLPVVELESLTETLRHLQRHGTRIVAAHPATTPLTPSQFDFRQDVCLVFGNEGYGLSQEVLAACHCSVAIPMQRGVDSLNVGNASAAFLYEVSRQRGLA